MKRITTFRQSRPVLWILLWTAVAFLAFYFLPVRQDQLADRALVLLLVLAFFRAIFLMVRHTRIWTWRGQGLLGTVAGDLLLYLSLGFGAFIGFRAELLDLARAFLAVGVIHLLIGLEPRNMERTIVEDTEPATPAPGGEAVYDDL